MAHDDDHEHGDDCDHEHDDEMVSISIEPRGEELASRGISMAAFEAALPAAIDAYHDRLDALPEDAEDIPALEDATVEIEGRSFRLGDLADLILADEDDLDDEDGEFDEDEEFEDDEDEVDGEAK